MKLKYILINSFTNNNSTNKVRLGKPPVKRNIKMEFNVFIGRNFNFIALAVMIAVILFFIWFCFFITGVAAVESGMLRNFINTGV